MHYHVMPQDQSDFRKCHSLAECEGYARETGPGLYAVVATNQRLGVDSESWLWGHITHDKGGRIEITKMERGQGDGEDG